MLTDSLFICYSTPNYSKLTDIFLESLNNIHVKNIDHKLDNPCTSINVTGFQTNLWYYCIREKINQLIRVLIKNNGSPNVKYFIFTDCDIIYIKKNMNKWNNLENYITNTDNDIYFMREGVSEDVNSGFFIIKNNSNLTYNINFFIRVLLTIDRTEKKNMPLGDQTVINSLKNNINYGFIPNDYVVFGNTIYNKDKSLFHHAVCCRDIDDKIEQINIVKTHFVDL